MKPRLAAKHARARKLRHSGWPIKQIARHISVSPSTVSCWCRDIELSPEQRKRNQLRAAGARGPGWAEHNRNRRRAYQQEGRAKARLGDPEHAMGCMLYWAEGAKSRNTLTFANSDPAMIETFARFLRTCLGVRSEDFRFRVNVYLDNGLDLEEVEEFWAEKIGCPRDAARKAVVNHFPTSSSGRRPKKLPYGVCTLIVRRSTWLVQHIFGAIQEYSGVDQPQWLDGPPRKPQSS